MSQQYGKKGGGKPSANPLFEQWLMEWREDAVQKNSKLQYAYNKALTSLKKYPLQLSNGRDCLLLENFGPVLAKKIDKRMEEENIGQDDEDAAPLADIMDPKEIEKMYKKPAKKRQKNAPDSAQSTQSQEEDPDDDEPSSQPTSMRVSKPKATKSKGREYIPVFRSGNYALMVALGLRETKAGYRGYMTKTELLQDAQAHCDASMTRSDNPSSSYTAWSGVATLITKGLIIKQGHPTQYMLSPAGRELSAKLLKADLGIQLPSIEEEEDQDDDSQSSAGNGALDNSMLHYRTVFEPGQFEVVLYVDTSETSAKCKQEDVIAELRKNGVSFEVVRLSVGDFVWVCREIANPVANKNRLTISRRAELVLPYVVERKRSDDLAHSIKDGRFHEQKFRLRKTGLQAVYLLEDHGRGDWGLAEGALKQAMANTQMTDGFMVQETNGIKDTCGYLTHMTRLLKRTYEGKKISSCTTQEWPSYKERGIGNEMFLMIFSDFNDFSVKAKNWTVQEMFARHLMRLRGLSVERAYAIVQKYPTLTHLMRAYQNCKTEKEGELLLSLLFFGNSGRTIGPAVSRTIYHLYTDKKLT